MERLRASRSLPFVVVQKTFMTSDNDRELAAFCHRQAHQEPPGATNGSRAILPAPPPEQRRLRERPRGPRNPTASPPFVFSRAFVHPLPVTRRFTCGLSPGRSLNRTLAARRGISGELVHVQTCANLCVTTPTR